MTLGGRVTTFLALLAGAGTSALASQPVPASYEVLETVSVPPDGSIATSKTILAAGATYWLVAAGSDAGAGDAEYDWTGQDRCGSVPPLTDVGIAASTGFPGFPVRTASSLLDKLPFWGPPDPGHVYAQALTGRGGPLFVSYRDCTYDDNVGGLTVWVLGQQTYPGPTCDVVFSMTTFGDGEPVTPHLLRLSNSDTKAVTVEFKLWLRMPGFGPVSLASVGGDGKFQLPGNYHNEIRNVPLFTVTPDYPRGTYELACTLTDPTTGEVIDRRVDRFGIR